MFLFELYFDSKETSLFLLKVLLGVHIMCI